MGDEAHSESLSSHSGSPSSASGHTTGSFPSLCPLLITGGAEGLATVEVTMGPEAGSIPLVEEMGSLIESLWKDITDGFPAAVGATARIMGSLPTHRGAQSPKVMPSMIWALMAICLAVGPKHSSIV
jgi:hypothetical protein